MANAIVTIKIMPESPEINMDDLLVKVKAAIQDYAGEGETRSEIEPIAFGLKALKVTFVVDEAKGSPEPLEKTIDAFDEVNSVETIDVRRAIG